MKRPKWKEDFEKLVKRITDDFDEDFVRCLLDEGFESEERAQELTQFIQDNNIDCRDCAFDKQRYSDYMKLSDKMAETWEVIDEYFPAED